LNGTVLTIQGSVSSLDGRKSVSGTLSGPPDLAEAIGAELAEDLLNRGGSGILEEIREGPDGSGGPGAL
jgi:hydroxymethylbilane synthase